MRVAIGTILLLGLTSAAAGDTGNGTLPEWPIDAVAAELAATPGLVLVDYYARWCPTCVRDFGALEKLANEFAGRIRFVRVNVDRDVPIRKRMGFWGVPAYVLYRDGQRVDQFREFPFFFKWRLRRMLERAL